MFIVLVLLGCSGGSKGSDGDGHPGEDVGGLDTAPVVVDHLFEDAELQGCGWLYMIGETSAVGKDWFVRAQLDPLGLDAEAEGPLALEQELAEGWYLDFLDVSEGGGPMGLSGRACDGSRYDVHGFLYMILAGTVSLEAERTTSPSCGDDTAWDLSLRVFDAEVSCFTCTIEVAETVEIGPVHAVVETSPCD